MESQLKENKTIPASNGNMADQFKHINGWGIDADPENEPTYPMKKWTGDDHRRSNYIRPVQQQLDVEILHSNERPNVSAVFGTVCPPSGLSGAIRRYAFRYSEESLRHWVMLMMADRINVVEGIIEDLAHGIIPNIISEKGMKAEWKHNPKAVIRKAAIATAIATTLIVLLSSRKKNKVAGAY